MWQEQKKLDKHVEFAQEALRQAHPLVHDEPQLGERLEHALEQLMDLTTKEVRDHRRQMVSWIVKRAKLLRDNGEVGKWLTKVDPACRGVVRTINGPLLRELMEVVGYDNPEVMRQLEQGVAMTGPLPGSPENEPIAVDKEKLTTINDLWCARLARNKELLRALKVDEHSGELMRQVREEVVEGKVCEPWIINDEDADGTLLCHRFARVQGTKSDGRPRIRAVDNGTKCGVYDAAAMTRKLKMGSIDELLTVLKRRYRRRPGKYKAVKADVKGAFRRVPVRKRDRWMTTAAFRHDGNVWATQHMAAPFGFLASVPAWDIMGEALQVIVIKMLIMVLLRYVDDYFTVEEDELADEAAEQIQTVLEAIMGDGAVPAEKCLAANPLVVLGVEVTIEDEKVTCKIPEDKRKVWGAMAAQALDDKHLSAADAAVLAGRLSFAATKTFRRYGRAMVRPIFRQQYEPLPDGRISNELKEALEWWVEILKNEITEEVSLVKVVKEHVVLLCDASGNNAHLAAVLVTNNGTKYVEMETPSEWKSWFTQRADKQIFGLEALAVVLGLESFRDELRDKHVSIYTDNAGVLGALTKGSTKEPDHNTMVHLLWHRIAVDKLGVWFNRVPTDDNIADGPTRRWFDALSKMCAERCRATLPKGGCL